MIEYHIHYSIQKLSSISDMIALLTYLNSKNLIFKKALKCGHFGHKSHFFLSLDPNISTQLRLQLNDIDVLTLRLI
jgi:hypothetical protein